MKDISLAVLEGMIHNIRTPLNLILGYAQQLQKEGNSPYLERIYQAGIKIDDIMQGTWEAIEQRNPQIDRICLNEWLKSELKLLNNHLHLKHRLRIEQHLPETDVWCEVSTLQLSLWFESLLLCVSECISESPILLRISLLDNVSMQIDIATPHINAITLNKLLSCKSENDRPFISTNLIQKDNELQIQVTFT
ncbi:MAG: histidine kinase dimerization/phospho-acceptor domain-containing protein [Candidatus Cloacimonetes bacterium]|nr:histidine kinase dimerization/phospho-acceptor domain-containing protein [Candidatus Cloacimonadota bacterium]